MKKKLKWNKKNKKREWNKLNKELRIKERLGCENIEKMQKDSRTYKNIEKTFMFLGFLMFF